MLLVYLLIIFFNISISTLPFLIGKINSTKLFFSALSMCLSSWCIFNYFSWTINTLIFHQFAFFFMSFFPLFLLFFILSYPKNLINFNLFNILIYSIIPLFFSILSFTPLIVEKIDSVGNIVFSYAQPWYMMYIILYLSIALIISLKSYFSCVGDDKQSLLLFFTGLFSALIMSLSTNLVLPLLGLQQFYILGPVLTSFTFVSFMAYALLKHKFLEIRLLIGKPLSLIFTSLVFSALYFTLYFVFIAYFDRYLSFNILSIFSVIYWLIASYFFGIVRVHLQSSAEKIFLKGIYDYKKLLLKSQEALSNCVTQTQLLQSLFDLFLDELELSNVYIALPSNFTNQKNVSKQLNFYHFYNQNIIQHNFFLNITTIEDFLINTDAVSSTNLNSVPLSLKEAFKVTSSHILIRCVHHQQCFALIFLGQKLTQDKFTNDDILFLNTLTAQISMVLQRIHMSRVNTEINIAQKIQSDIIPSQIKSTFCKISTFISPISEVGGDYFDIIELKDRTWIILGDVSGHGLGAGLIMFMLQSIIGTLIHEFPNSSPAEINHKANKHLCSTIKRLSNKGHVTIATLCCIHESSRVYFSGNQDSLFVYKADQHQIKNLDMDHLPIGLGLFEDLDSSQIQQDYFDLNKNDFFFIGSDGVTESYLNGDTNLEQFGMKRLQSCLIESANFDANTIKENIYNNLKDFSNNHFHDDVTFIIAKKDF